MWAKNSVLGNADEMSDINLSIKVYFISSYGLQKINQMPIVRFSNLNYNF